MQIPGVVSGVGLWMGMGMGMGMCPRMGMVQGESMCLSHGHVGGDEYEELLKLSEDWIEWYLLRETAAKALLSGTRKRARKADGNATDA